MYGNGYSLFNGITFLGARGGVAFDTDAQAFITAAAITDPTQQSAVNQFYLDLKAANIYTKMKAMYLPITGSAATSKFNMVDPRDLDAAFRLSFSGGWTFSSSGATPNGTTGYANTFLNSAAHLPSDNAHLSVYSRTEQVADVYEMGGTTLSPNNFCHLAVRYTGDIMYYPLLTATGVSYTGVTSSVGHFIGSRIGINSTAAFIDGTQFHTSNFVSTGGNSTNIVLGGISIGGSVSNYSNKQVAFWSIGSGLNATEAGDFYTAVQTMMTTLGINV